MRNEEEEEWNDALAEYRAPHNSWNVTRHPGCQLVGHVMVDKAPGKFVIHAESYGHDFAAHMTNLSHIVEHFSFGDKHELQDVPEELPPKFLRSLHPMDGNVYVTGELHQAYHHHMKVITTDFFCGSKVMQWTKGKCTRLFRILQNSQLSTYRRNIVPGEDSITTLYFTAHNSHLFSNQCFSDAFHISNQRSNGRMRFRQWQYHTSRNRGLGTTT